MLTILQWTDTTLAILKWGTFSPFSSLVILFLVVPSDVITSDMKNPRKYPFLILNVILFSLLFAYIIIGGLSVDSPNFLKIYSK